MQKIILVAQAPGRRSKEPLDGAAGRRLAALAGLDHAEFLKRFERVNLLDDQSGQPDVRAMRDRADDLRKRWNGRKAVLLGRHVALAFRLVNEDYEWFKPVQVEPGLELAVMPHPSGISTWWNAAENVKSARKFMLRLNVGFFAINRNKEKLPTGRPEKFTPEQVAAALVACDGLPLQAADLLAEETGISITREAVIDYCGRYPALAELRARLKQGIGDIAEMNVGQAVRDGDRKSSRWLLRSNMYSDRGYGLSVHARVNGRVQHDHRHAHLHAKLNGSLDLSQYSAEQLAAMRDLADALGVANPGGNQS